MPSNILVLLFSSFDPKAILQDSYLYCTFLQIRKMRHRLNDLHVMNLVNEKARV